MLGPPYRNVRVCGLPPAADESATGLEIAATYFATLAVTLHAAVPVGSQMIPSRGLQAESLATMLPLTLPRTMTDCASMLPLITAVSPRWSVPSV